MNECDLEKNLFPITLDNATNNDTMLKILKSQLQMMSGSDLLCDDKFMHVRLYAHIPNLIVKQGLKIANNVGKKKLANDVLYNIQISENISTKE